MDKSSDATRRDCDKALEMENKRLRAKVRRLLVDCVVVCVVFGVLACLGGLVLGTYSQQSAIEVYNIALLKTEAKLVECIDARVALQMSNDMLSSALSGGECRCSIDWGTDYKGNIVPHEYWRGGSPLDGYPDIESAP
jgi:hypothetical protein